MRIPLAIVGNGGAAAEAVLALRANGYSGDIHLFADNNHAPYNPMLGTYLISGALPPERVFPFGDRDSFYGGHRVTAHLGSEVVNLDAREQTLASSDGGLYQYDRCLVASGARPSLPPIAGLREALAGEPAERRVFTLRSLADALALKEALGRLRHGEGAAGAAGATIGAREPAIAARAAVIGASLVGIKIAALFHELGLDVRLIEREPHVLPLAAHADCAEIMEASLVEDGYALMLGASLLAVETIGQKVRLTFDGQTGPEDFDLVVVCTGIRPSLAFLSPGRVETETGILVDEHMRSSAPTLFAAGDVAQGMNLMSGRSETIALWASARYQGRAAGRSLAGAPGGYRGSIPSSISHVGRMLFASVGRLRDYDELTTRRAGEGLELKAWQGGRLIGVNLLNCCLPAGAMKQALQKAMVGTAAGTSTSAEASWISFNG